MLRRSFLSRFGAVAALGAGDLQAAAPAPAPAATAKWEATRHEQDDWFDGFSAKHRVLFDTWSASRFPDGIMFGGNYFRANRDYGLTDKDLTVILCVRHQTAPFAFNDAMWAKYGKAFSKRMEWVDPRTQEAPSTNVHLRQLTNLTRMGLQFAICNLTTRAYTQIIGEQTKTSPDEVYKELAANTVGPAHFVPAGVVAASRAQEHGYTIISIG